MTNTLTAEGITLTVDPNTGALSSLVRGAEFLTYPAHWTLYTLSATGEVAVSDLTGGVVSPPAFTTDTDTLHVSGSGGFVAGFAPAGATTDSSTVFEKTMTLYRNRVQIMAYITPEATTKNGASIVSLDVFPTLDMTRIYTYSPTIYPYPFLSGNVSLQASQDGAIIFATPDKSRAMACYTRGEVSSTSTRGIIASVGTYRLQSMIPAGLSTTTFAVEQFIAVGTFDEVVAASREIYTGTVESSTGQVPVAVSVVDAPASVEVPDTWSFIAQVVDADGLVVGTYNDDVVLTGAVSATVQASSGTAVFSGLASSVGPLPFTVSSGDLIPATFSVEGVNPTADLISISPAAYNEDAVPGSITLLGTFLPGMVAYIDGAPVATVGNTITPVPSLSVGTHLVQALNPDASLSAAVPLTVAVAGTGQTTPTADSYAILPVVSDVPSQATFYVAAVDTVQYASGDLAGIDTTYNETISLLATTSPMASSSPAPAFGPVNIVNGVGVLTVTLFDDGAYVVEATGALTTATASFNVSNQVGAITTISPPSVTELSGDTVITVNGVYWPVGDTTIRVNGLAVPTLWLNIGQVQATIPSSYFDVTGFLFIDAIISNGGTTNTVQLEVTSQAIPATGLEFSVVPPGGSGTYVVQALDEFGGPADYSGTVTLSQASGPGGITGTLTSTMVAGSATFPGITVSGVGDHVLVASIAGLPSTTTTVTVDPSTAVLLSIAPNAYNLGQEPAVLSANGMSFEPGAQATFVGSSSTTVAATNILGSSLDIPTPTLAAGTYQVSITNPGAPESNALPVVVGPQVPVADSYKIVVPATAEVGPLSVAVEARDSVMGVPDSSYAGTADLTLNGGPPATITFVNGTAQHTITTSMSGTYALAVSGELGTDSTTFDAQYPAPVLSSISPTVMAAGDTVVMTLVSSSEILPGSTAQFSGPGTASAPVSVVDANTVTVEVPHTLTAFPGGVNVALEIGGQVSEVLPFTVTPNAATSLDTLAPSIVVDPTGYQRVRPFEAHVSSSNPIEAALAAVTLTLSDSGTYAATDVILIEGGSYPGGVVMAQGTADAPIVIRKGHGRPVVTSDLDYRQARYIRWYDATLLGGTWMVKTQTKTLSASGTIFGNAANDHSGNQFWRTRFLGQWDMRAVRLSATETIFAPYAAGAPMYDEDGALIGPMPYTTAQVDAAVAAGTFIDGTPYPDGRPGHAFFPGDVTDPSHLNYDPIYPAVLPPPSDTGGAFLANAGDISFKACVFKNIPNLGLRVNGMKGDVSASLCQFSQCYSGAILVDNGLTVSPLSSSLDVRDTAAQHPADSGGPAFGTLLLDQCTFDSCGYPTYQVRIVGLPQGQVMHSGCSYTATVGHLAYGGGLQIKAPAQFANNALNVWYDHVSTQDGLPYITWDEELTGFVGHNCTSGTSPLEGTADFDFVCAWPYIPGTDLANQVYPTTIVGDADIADGSYIQQVGGALISGSSWSMPSGNRPQVSLGGIRALTIDGSVVSGAQGLAIDPVYNGKHISPLTDTVTSNVPNTINAPFSYEGSNYDTGLLQLSLQGENPASTPGSIFAIFKVNRPASGDFLLRGTVPIPDTFSITSLRALGLEVEDSLGFRYAAQIEPVSWYPSGNVAIMEVLSLVHNQGTTTYNLVQP